MTTNIPKTNQLTWINWLLVFAAGAGTYVLLARLGLKLASIHGNVSPVWPATGFAIWLVIRFGRGLWPAIALGAFVANALTEIPVGVATAIAAGNTLEAIVGAWLWQWGQTRWSKMPELRELISCLGASLLGPLASATVGVSALIISGAVSRDAAGSLWITWWTGDALGSLTVLPLLLAALQTKEWGGSVPVRWVGQGLLLLAVTTGTSAFAFLVPSGGAFLFAIFPVLLLAVTWFGAPAARFAALLISIAGIAAAYFGHGPFTTGHANQDILNLQVFLAAVTITALVLPVFYANRGSRLPVVVLLAGWMLSGWVFATAQRQSISSAEEIFSERVTVAETNLRGRMATYEEALHGGASLFSASVSVERDEWRAYAESLQLEKRFPGINGIGVVFRVERPNVDAFLKRTRDDGVSEFDIYSVPGVTAPPGNEHYVITYLEPVALNRQTLGLDLATEANRRKAADEARDSGEPRMSGRVFLVQDGQRRPGFLLYLPLYRKGAAHSTTAERGVALEGWVYAPFITANFLEGVLGSQQEKLQLHFFEHGGMDRDHLIYSSRGEGQHIPVKFERVTEMELEGQRFQLGWSRGPLYPQVGLSPMVWAAASFALATLLLAGLVASLQTIRQRAERLTAERTEQLEKAQRLLAAVNQVQTSVLNGTTYSIISTTPDGVIETFNTGAEVMLGYSAEEMVGRLTVLAIHDQAEVATHAAALSAELKQVVEPGFEAFVIRARLGGVDEREWTYVRKDGSRLPVLLSVTALHDDAGAITGFLGIAYDLIEQKRARQELIEVTEMLRRTGEMAQIGGWELDLRTMDLVWSRETCRIHEVDPPVAPQLDQAISFYAPDARAVIEEAVQNGIKHGTPWDLELPLNTAKGRAIWVRAQGAVVRDDEKIVKLTGTFQDITERKQSERALLESEEQFRSFAQLAPVGICRTDPKGRCLFVNERWCEITGRNSEQALGVNWGAALHPEDRRRVFAAWAALVRGERESALEYRFVHPDGSVVWVAGSAVPVRDAAGGIKGFLGTVTDISLAKSAKVAMEESEERFRQAFEFAGIGMAIVGLDGQWVRVNRAICDIVGYSAEELMRKTFQDITHPSDLGSDLAQVGELLAGTRRAYQMEKRYFHRDGHVVWVHLTASLVRDLAGEPLHFVSQIEDITVRKKLELELSASEERVRLATSAAGVGVWDWDFDTNQITWDEQMFALYGLPPSPNGKVDYSVWAGALTPEELVRQEAIMQNTRAERGASEREFRIQRYSDKATRVLQASEIVKSDGDGPVRMVGVNRDVTELRQNEAILRTSEERLSNIYRAMANGLVLQDATGRILECNPAAERILGLTREQIMGRNSLDPRWRAIRRDGGSFPGEEHPALVTLRTGRPVLDCEMGVHKPDGSITWISINSEPLAITNAAVREVVCVFSDITERKRLEEAVHRERELLRSVIELLPSPIYLKDHDTRFLMVNQALAECLRKNSPAELVGLQDFDLFDSKVAAGFRADDEAVLAGREVRDREETTVFPNGETRTYLTTKVPFRDGKGKITGILGIGVDITERRQLLDSLALARDQALEASQLKSAFLANMSHEIRTPMNGIIGMSGLLIDTPLDTDQQGMARVIQQSAESLLTIINDILDFSKIEAGKMRIEPVEMEMRSLIDDTVALLAGQARGKNLKLSAKFDARLEGPLSGDAGRIRQVLLNLTGNALKFTRQGEVSIVASCVEEQAKAVVVQIEIKDTGVGIPAAAQAQLFQSFVQADSSTTRRFGGTGLGLAISRQLIELMGGEIGLHSQEGQGSTFWFRLTLPKLSLKNAAKHGPAELVAEADVPRKSLRFLVAEDNLTNQMVARGFLEKMGHQVDFASNGHEALRMFPLKSYDAILMDCQMPEMDGYTATRRIRSGAAGGDPTIPIIALTAFAMSSDRVKCIDAGMNDYLAKPLRKEELQRVLGACGLTGRAPLRPKDQAVAGTSALRPDQVKQLQELPGRKYNTLLQDVAEIFLEETPATLATLH